jgi:hypothetical protein
MTLERYLPRRDYLALHAAEQFLADLNGGPVGCARITRISHQDVSRVIADVSADDDEGEEQKKKRWFALDVVADLEAAKSAPVVTRVLADLLGFSLVKNPGVRASEDDVAGLCKIITESSEAAAVYGAAREDGKITRAERAAIRTKIDDAIEAFLELKARLDADEGNDDE